MGINMKELEYPFDAEWILKKKKHIKKVLEQEESGSFIEKKIAVLGGSTTDDIRKVLELFLLHYGIKPLFYESEYNRYYEEIMFPNPELSAFGPDILFIHTTNRNITDYPHMGDSAETVESKIKAVYDKFEAMWKRAEEIYHCPVIQNNFELPFYRLLGNRDTYDIHGRVYFIHRLNMLFSTYAQSHSDFYINDILYESASYGLEKWSAPFYWHMYKYALCVPAIPYLAFNVANIIKSVYGKNKKALVLDLDNTVWGGVIGDDGADNIEIGQETSLGQTYSEFQEYIKAHRELGVILAVNSKNNEETALAGLSRPEMVLKPEDFTVIKANWDAKDRNLGQIADELQLLPESFVFIDDNPAEREIVKNSFPETAVPEVAEAETYINIIDKSGFFETTNFSGDDLKRNDMYQENAARRKAALNYENYEEYLKSLEMKAGIKEFEPAYISRIAQLTNKSNQFNLTTKRYSQAEIEEIAGDQTYITLFGRLEDKFGDNGIVSVVIGKRQDAELHIDLWLMSCRVLKRDMEYAMMDELAFKCSRNGIRRILGYYYPTAKNGMVKDFYKLQGFTKISEDGQGNSVWEYNVTENYEPKNKVINVHETI